MRWITSEGGPLVLIPEAIAERWRGASGDGRDYAAACAVTDYAGVIQWYGAEVLVLNDEPLTTTTFMMDGTLALVRWMYAPNEAAIAALLRSDLVRRLPDPVEETIFTPTTAAHLLFDSGAPGDVAERIVVELAPRPHKVQTHVWKPNDETGLVVHVLHG